MMELILIIPIFLLIGHMIAILQMAKFPWDFNYLPFL